MKPESESTLEIIAESVIKIKYFSPPQKKQESDYYSIIKFVDPDDPPSFFGGVIFRNEENTVGNLWVKSLLINSRPRSEAWISKISKNLVRDEMLNRFLSKKEIDDIVN